LNQIARILDLLTASWQVRTSATFAVGRLGSGDAWQGSVAGREVLTARRGIYRKVTLFAGHVVFDEVGMLETHEFDGEAIFDMADNAALRLADRYDDADGRAEIGR
jgi:hypothetical protein